MGRVDTDATTEQPTTLRFRHHRGRAVAGLIITISLLTLVPVSAWFALLLVPPAAWTVWVWRAGTDADPAGVRVRALVATRRVPWSRVEALATEPGGQVVANLTSGTQLPLTAVTATDVPRLAALAPATSR